MLQSELPKALLAALDPAYWQERLKMSATKTLRKAWEGERNLALHELYERLTPRIVATIMGAYYESGVWFQMAVPPGWTEDAGGWPDLARAAAFNAALASALPAGAPGRGPGRPTKMSIDEMLLTHPEEQKNLEKVRQAILDWVTFEKDWDERDYHADGTPSTPQERAERVMEILGVGEPGARTVDMDVAAIGLAAAIESWLAGEGSTSPEMAQSARAAEAAQHGEPESKSASRLDPAVAHEWLEKVLAGWVALVRRDLPRRIERELDKLRSRLKAPSLPGLGHAV